METGKVKSIAFSDNNNQIVDTTDEDTNRRFELEDPVRVCDPELGKDQRNIKMTDHEESGCTVLQDDTSHSETEKLDGLSLEQMEIENLLPLETSSHVKEKDSTNATPVENNLTFDFKKQDFELMSQNRIIQQCTDPQSFCRMNDKRFPGQKCSVQSFARDLKGNSKTIIKAFFSTPLALPLKTKKFPAAPKGSLGMYRAETGPRAAVHLVKKSSNSSQPILSPKIMLNRKESTGQNLNENFPAPFSRKSLIEVVSKKSLTPVLEIPTLDAESALTLTKEMEALIWINFDRK